MTIRFGICAALCLLVWTGALASPPEKAKPRVASSGRPQGEESSAKSRTTIRSGLLDDRTRGQTATVAGGKSIRTIDAINIEGKIAVPQVLFISSRDNRRYRDGLGKNFRMSTLDLARGATIPNRLCVDGSLGSKTLKEE